MLRVTPKLLQALNPGDDRTRLMFENLGITADMLDTSGVPIVIRPSHRTDHRRLAAVAVDLTARLQPLVSGIWIDAAEPEEVVGDLAGRLPVDVTDDAAPHEAIEIAVGLDIATADITADAAAWGFLLGSVADLAPARVPVGRLAGAAVVSGEAFKLAFARLQPNAAFTARLEPAQGPFSLWDYTASLVGPDFDRLALDVILVGAGGVGAGEIVCFGDFGTTLTGDIRLVDGDIIEMHNLNRVVYATVDGAQLRRLKVDDAAAYLRSRLPYVRVDTEPTDYSTFKGSVGSRAARRFPLVITGLDSDEARCEVQRDLPRVLIDGATGADANCTIQRVAFLDGPCVGCARPPRSARPAEDLECDAPPAPHAPSVSFVSFFAGVGAAGEAIKCAVGADGEETFFEHVFVYGPNPDMASQLAKHPRCEVDCTNDDVVGDYRSKWGEMN
jgi:molybdopterin/thiamine biosynthesis adenylyltransferase